jgi:FtsP/CotA-like multicopper oxidase with cupredoxin domain
MRLIAHSRTSALAVAAAVVAGLTSAAAPASAATVTIDLCAVPGSVMLPGAATVPIWGFGLPTTPGDCSTATAGLPGPTLDVTVGDTVTLSVTNALPGSRALSIEVPGIDFDAGPTEAASGGTVTRTFTANAPGTYLYRSTGDAGRQTAMGLAGALVVRPVTPGQAYGPTTGYDVEALLVLGAIDPAFNAAPDTFDLHAFRATYWLLNGKAYPDTAPGVAAAPGQRVLLRYLNAGYDNSTMALLGMHEHVVARDAHLLGHPFDANAETIPAGATEDAIATMPTTTPPSTNGFPLYNRQLHLTNGPQTGPTPNQGGALTFLHS